MKATYVDVHQTELHENKLLAHQETPVMIEKNVEKRATIANKAAAMREVEDIHIDQFHIWYNAVEEGIKSPIISHFGGGLVHNV